MSDPSIQDTVTLLLVLIQEQLTLVQEQIKQELFKIPKKIEDSIQLVLGKYQHEFEEKLKQRDLRIEKLEEKLARLDRSPATVDDSPPNPDDDFDWPDSTVLPFKDVPIVNKSEKDVVFVGDSIIRHVDMKRMTGSDNCEKDCNPGFDVIQIRNRMVEIDSNFTAKKLILHVGTNAIPDVPAHTVLKQTLKLIHDIRNQMPSTHLFVSAILPKIKSDFNPGINFINYKLFMAASKHNYTFIQHPQFSQNGKLDFKLFAPTEVANKKPIHLSWKGVGTFATNIKRAIKPRPIGTVEPLIAATSE